MDPLIRARQSMLDHETTILIKIRNLKADILNDLNMAQRKYIDGVDKLNVVRQSSERENLNILESGLDYIKANWYSTLKKFREAEKREQAQLAVLLLAQKNLKSMEKLQERYQEEMQEWQLKTEQKMLDEKAIRSFIDKR